MRKTLGALLLVALGACRSQLPAADVVARVNGEAISKQAFEEVVSRSLKRFGDQRSALPDGVVARLQEGVLQGMIVERVVAQRAEAEGVEVTDAELATTLAKHRERFRSPEAYEDYLARSNTTEPVLREELRRGLLRDRLVDKLGGAQEIDDAQVRRYYEDNLEQFTEPEQLRAHRLWLAYPKEASTAERRRVRARAQKLHERARREHHEPQAFAALCGEVSEGPEASRHGDTGPLVTGRLPELDRLVAQGFAVGQISELVEANHGVGFFRLDVHAPRRRRPLIEVHDAIHSTLLVHRRNEQRQESLRALREQARVETFVSFAPAPSASPKPPGAKPPVPPAAKAGVDVG